jgi:hypothetical protein
MIYLTHKTPNKDTYLLEMLLFTADSSTIDETYMYASGNARRDDLIQLFIRFKSAEIDWCSAQTVEVRKVHVEKRVTYLRGFAQRLVH